MVDFLDLKAKTSSPSKTMKFEGDNAHFALEAAENNVLALALVEKNGVDSKYPLLMAILNLSNALQEPKLGGDKLSSPEAFNAAEAYASDVKTFLASREYADMVGNRGKGGRQ